MQRYKLHLNRQPDTNTLCAALNALEGRSEKKEGKCSHSINGKGPKTS